MNVRSFDFPSEILVRLTPSDEVLELRERARKLEQELSKLQEDFKRVEYYYRCESLVNMELLDLCKAHGVKVRASMFQRPKLEE